MKNQFRYYKPSDSIVFDSLSKNIIMSNDYACELKYQGYTFHSVEQMYYWMLFSKNTKIQNKIMEFSGTSNGFDVRRFCKTQIDKIDKDYMMKKNKCMLKCIEIKYQQCEEFRTALKESKGKYLVQHIPWDTELGTIWNNQEHVFVGINACGRLLMKVRENAINGLYNDNKDKKEYDK